MQTNVFFLPILVILAAGVVAGKTAEQRQAMHGVHKAETAEVRTMPVAPKCSATLQDYCDQGS